MVDMSMHRCKVGASGQIWVKLYTLLVLTWCHFRLWWGLFRWHRHIGLTVQCILHVLSSPSGSSGCGHSGYSDVNTARRSRCSHRRGKPGTTSSKPTNLLEINPLPFWNLLQTSNFTSSLLLTKSLAVWKRYSLWRRHRKEQYAIADEHFKTRALPK